MQKDKKIMDVYTRRLYIIQEFLFSLFCRFNY